MTTPPTEPRDFAAFLVETPSGRTHTELSEALRDPVAKVVDTGKAGALGLVVKVAPMKGDPSTLVVTDEIKLKLPEHDRKASVFWPDKDGNLVRNDPNQRSIFELSEAPPPNVDLTTGEVWD